MENKEKHIQEIKEIITKTIKETVNGKIDQAIKIAEASAQTAYHVSLENIAMSKELKKEIKIIQETLAPISEIYNNLTGTKKVLRYVFILATLIIGFIISIKTLLK